MQNFVGLAGALPRPHDGLLFKPGVIFVYTSNYLSIFIMNRLTIVLLLQFRLQPTELNRTEPIDTMQFALEKNQKIIR